MNAVDPAYRPATIDPVTGYRELPAWRAQPYIRARPVSTEIGGNEELVDAEVNGETTSELHFLVQAAYEPR